MTWQLGAVLNAVIALCYLTITWLILRGLWRTGQVTSNALALATAAIFFTCGVHHGGHSIHVLLPALGIDRTHGLAMRQAFTWQMDMWDVVGAGVAIFYLSLRRSYGRLLDRPEMFENQMRQRYEEELERERTALAEAQRLASLGSWEWEARTARLSRSDELSRLLGVAPETALTLEEMMELVHPEDRARVRGQLQAALEGKPSEGEHRIIRPDGEIRVVRSRRYGRRNDAGELTHVIGTIQDITEVQAVWDELEAVNARFEAVLENSPTAIFMRDTEARFVLANSRTAELLGSSRAELMGRPLRELLPPETAELMERSDREVISSGTPIQQEESIPDAREDGRRHAFLSLKFPVQDSAGRAIGVGGVSLDITDRVAIERALRVAEERLRVTIDHAPIGVALVELQGEQRGRLLTVNEALCELVDHSETDLLKMALTSIVHPEDAGALQRDLALLADDDEARWEREVRCLHRDGHIIWVLLSAAAVADGAGGGRYAVVHARDIEERKRFEGQLQYLADHDALTGLYNRRRFEEELVRAVAHADRYRSRGAVLLIDLDGFKYVNDTLGHSYGDQLITKVGSLLQGALRNTDVVARLGGDEFAVILPHADVEEALVVCEKVLDALQGHAIALSENRHARVTASIGVTAYECSGGLTAEELIVEADIAMYEAKAEGKNQASVYVRDADHHTGLLARQSWLERLKAAIEEERFELMAQPVVGICANGVDRYELLLRLRGDDDELIPPGTFLYIAERFDLIQQIDRWVFAQAVALLHRCRDAGHDISLSVNMSGKTLGDPMLLDDITAIVSQRPVRSDRLVVEVTETAAIVNIDKAREVAQGLRALGCQFALDDFGAGFASFYYLKHLEFDFLKIDGEFIKTLSRDPTDQLVVRSVVQIAHGLGARTIAEFVGDQNTVEHLEELRVDYGQGYFLGRPQPVEEILPVRVAGR